MRKTVKNLNNLYSSAFEKIKKMSEFLGKKCIDHALDFHYGHRIKINKQFTNELYPIPLLLFKVRGIKAESFFDIYTNKNYIGYIKLYPNKEEILSLNLETFANLKYLIYGYNYQQEMYNSEDLEQTKAKIKESKETKFIIYADLKNLVQIFNMIESLSTKSCKNYSTACYKCNCGHEITIEMYNGSCPICGKESPYKRKFKTKCPVCGNKCLKDQYGNGKCESCGWTLDSFAEKRKDNVIYPNLISLNKAKKLYSEGKPFEPDLNEFMEALHGYSEMQFKYNGVYYAVELVFYDKSEPKISLYNSQTKAITIFNDDEDFKNNAKVEGKLLKDIWNDTTERDWLQ